MKYKEAQTLQVALQTKPYNRNQVFSDTDPQMLFAIWQMEFGKDPEDTLDEIQDAEVIYDKFRPRLSSKIK